MRHIKFTYWSVLLLLIGVVPSAMAQTTTLSGYVKEAATGRPMPFANVYLNNTTYGTTTDEKGFFKLATVPLGTIEVVASFVGYQTSKQTIRISNGQAPSITFRLQVGSQTLVGVTVKAKRNNKVWQQQLRQFKQQLFGEPFGSQCTLVNSNVLQFIEENGHLKATASEPLNIENEALGYRIWYDLSYFDGEAKQVYYGGTARFQEIKPANERQLNRFQRNRLRAYLGSARHLIASLIAGNYEKEGFLIYQEDTLVAKALPGDSVTLKRAIGQRLLPINTSRLIYPGQLPFERQVGSVKPLVVFYTKAKSLYSPYMDARYAYTQIRFPNGPMNVLTDGWVTAPNGVEMQGSLADDRLSTLLPADWQPPQMSQEIVTASLSNGLQKLQTATPLYTAEKIYVHTDRSQYVAGDTLWFNTYLVDGTSHQPNALSQTLYVDLLDTDGNPIISRVLHVDSTGHTPGDMTLPDSLPSGNYQLLAYTNWMRNEDNDFLFRKPIRIEASSKVASEPTKHANGFTLQLFPEGGRLVLGLPARVAFQALDPQGHSLSITGVLINQQGDTLTDFRSLHQGMGTLSFTPQPNQHYKAVAKSADGQLLSVPLPEALTTGYQLTVDNLTSPHQVRILIRNNQLQMRQLTLFAHMRGQVCYQAQLDASKAEAFLSIPYDSIRQDGVLHITLFDPENLPVAERLVFINQNRQVNIRIQSDKPTYQSRQPVSLTLSTSDEQGKPLSVPLSLAITDAEQDINATFSRATIRSYLLLTSDLKGHIDDPEFYFDSTQAHVRQYLDYVMMTHGWRRFTWKAILSDSSVKPTYNVETSLHLNGLAWYADTKKVARELALSGLIRTNRNITSVEAKTDKDGLFVIQNLLFADTAAVVFHPQTERIIKLSWLPQDLPDYVAVPTLTNVTDNQTVINQALEMQALAKEFRGNGGRLLQAVTVRALHTNINQVDYRRIMYGVADATIVATDQLRSLPSVLAMVAGQAAGVDVLMKPDGSGSIFIRNSHANVMIDGRFVQDQVLQTINPNDVEAIDVLKNADKTAIYGVQAPGGAVNILLRHGPGEDKKINQVVSKVMGYAVSREFYSPQYTNETINTTRPDYRATLYWNPSVQTDANGHATVKFYNTDKATTVQVTAEGISVAGQPGYGKMTYSITK